MTASRFTPLWVITLLAFSSLSLSACSVGMAISGDENPNLAVCTEGSTRLEIERELGAPKTTELYDDGTYQCTYEYELGDEPSAGRAAGHAALDVLTFGIWEIAGTPTELSMGDRFELTVVYGEDGVAQEVTSRQLE